VGTLGSRTNVRFYQGFFGGGNDGNPKNVKSL
jgi:hypothetical protein